MIESNCFADDALRFVFFQPAEIAGPCLNLELTHGNPAGRFLVRQKRSPVRQAASREVCRALVSDPYGVDMLLLKNCGEATQVLAPIKSTIDEEPAAIRSGDLIEIRNEVGSRTNASYDIPDDKKSSHTSVGDGLGSTAPSLPETNQSVRAK